MVQAFVLIQAGGKSGLPGRAAVSAIHVVRSADIVTGPFDVVARVEAAHRCAREARRQDRGGRGHHLDPDLPGGAALPAARSGRTADPNTRSEASISRISRLRGESEFPRPTGHEPQRGANIFARRSRAHTVSCNRPRLTPPFCRGGRIRTRHLTVGCVYMSELESNRSSVRT